MNDRFKFRYYNKLANKMVEPTNWQNLDAIYECIVQQICFDNDIAPLPYDHIGNGLVFMQCTGLKDKNGKLIYEGDILKQPDGIIDYVCWSDGCYIHNGTAITNYDTCYQGDAWAKEVNTHEVIGNIYENPELLED